MGNVARLPTPGDRGHRPSLAPESFTNVNAFLPQSEGGPETVTPSTPVLEALEIMRSKGYSQLPVVDAAGVVHGLFSYRSFALGAAEMAGERYRPEALEVDEFLEEAVFLHVRDEVGSAVRHLWDHDAVLVGAPDGLQAILTSADILKRLYELTRGFVLVREIELAVRDIIQLTLSADDLTAIFAGLKRPDGARSERPPVAALDELTFAQYHDVICQRERWPHFEPVLGPQKARLSKRLETVNHLRNDLFHFRREITDEDRQKLAGDVRWFSMRLDRAAERAATE